MSVSRLNLVKSETRELAELDRHAVTRWRLHEPTDWQMSNSVFFAAFVLIAAALAVLALVLR